MCPDAILEFLYSHWALLLAFETCNNMQTLIWPSWQWWHVWPAVWNGPHQNLICIFTKRFRTLDLHPSKERVSPCGIKNFLTKSLVEFHKTLYCWILFTNKTLRVMGQKNAAYQFSWIILSICVNIWWIWILNDHRYQLCHSYHVWTLNKYIHYALRSPAWKLC